MASAPPASVQAPSSSTLVPQDRAPDRPTPPALSLATQAPPLQATPLLVTGDLYQPREIVRADL